MRLIDANAYLKKVCTYNKTGCGSCRLQDKCPVNEPTVDAVPVVHGHWWHDDGADLNELTCSVCNKTYRMMMDLRANVYPHNYCPNCGARMDADD